MEQFLNDFHSYFISFGNEALILKDFITYSMPLFIVGLFWLYALERVIVYLAYYQENQGHNFTFQREIDNFFGAVVVIFFATVGFEQSLEYIYTKLEIANILTDLSKL